MVNNKNILFKEIFAMTTAPAKHRLFIYLSDTMRGGGKVNTDT